jgi:hypothetical protein
MFFVDVVVMAGYAYMFVAILCLVPSGMWLESGVA